MRLVVVATFGSLPEATIAFSSLDSAGFSPVAGFNMNTPGTANGMAPSAYPVLAPEAEARAARQFLSELRNNAAGHGGNAFEAPEEADEQSDSPPRTLLGRLRSVARFMVAGLLLAWLLTNGLLFLMRFR